MRTATKAALAAASVLPLFALGASSATAAPARAGAVTVVCGSMTYHTWVNGNGAWTPAHDLASTTTLVPLAFGPTTFVQYDPSGAIVDQGTEPAEAKGQSSNAAGAQWCTFAVDFTAPDGSRFTLSGDVLGKATPIG
jgi:hypothetical protein